jgi:hypothetical protein
MSSGRVEGDSEASVAEGERLADGLADGMADELADQLADDEEVHLSWTATDVRWANQWGADLDSPTVFAATDRRVLFETAEGVTSIGYNRMRAVNVDSPNRGPDLSVAFLACGGLCLVVGLLAAVRDFANGAALVVLSLALLVAGSAMGTTTEGATVTVVVGNERQRLSFSAEESVGARLSELVNDW